MSQQRYCSEISLQSQEALIGTATPTSVYLLLEYPHAWGPKAIPESGLPEAVRNWLGDQAEALPDAKALLIRGEASAKASGVYFFVAAVREQDPALYAFQLEHYEELLRLDIPALLDGSPAYQPHRCPGPLLLVCTHGRRDLCCAQKGLPVYQALRDADGRAPGMAWQVSHVGGHRFAANLISLPHGLLYGRVDPESALSILEAAQAGHVHLPNLRGRACYSQVVQAAEYHLRARSGETAVDRYRLMDAAETTPGTWRVRFQAPSAGAVHRLRLRVEETGVRIYQGCGLDKVAARIDYSLEGYEVEKL
jgi:hypothetical protein